MTEILCKNPRKTSFQSKDTKNMKTCKTHKKHEKTWKHAKLHDRKNPTVYRQEP